jgi:hypothetical protein
MIEPKAANAKMAEIHFRRVNLSSSLASVSVCCHASGVACADRAMAVQRTGGIAATRAVKRRSFDAAQRRAFSQSLIAVVWSSSLA